MPDGKRPNTGSISIRTMALCTPITEAMSWSGPELPTLTAAIRALFRNIPRSPETMWNQLLARGTMSNMTGLSMPQAIPRPATTVTLTTHRTPAKPQSLRPLPTSPASIAMPAGMRCSIMARLMSMSLTRLMSLAIRWITIRLSGCIGPRSARSISFMIRESERLMTTKIRRRSTLNWMGTPMLTTQTL